MRVGILYCHKGEKVIVKKVFHLYPFGVENLYLIDILL